MGVFKGLFLFYVIVFCLKLFSADTFFGFPVVSFVSGCFSPVVVDGAVLDVYVCGFFVLVVVIVVCCCCGLVVVVVVVMVVVVCVCVCVCMHLPT